MHLILRIFLQEKQYLLSIETFLETLNSLRCVSAEVDL